MPVMSVSSSNSTLTSAFPQLVQAFAGQAVSPLHNIVFLIINTIQAAFFLTLLNNKLEIRIKNNLIPPKSSTLNPDSTCEEPSADPSAAFTHPI